MTDANAPNWLLGNQLRNTLVDFCLILLVAIILAISFFMQSINPSENWFMRSGAVMVLIGAVMEFRHNKFLHTIDMTSVRWASGVGGPYIFEPSRLRSFLGYIAHVFVVIGTFIAAYGDLVQALFIA